MASTANISLTINFTINGLSYGTGTQNGDQINFELFGNSHTATVASGQGIAYLTGVDVPTDDDFLENITYTLTSSEYEGFPPLILDEVIDADEWGGGAGGFYYRTVNVSFIEAADGNSSLSHIGYPNGQVLYPDVSFYGGPDGDIALSVYANPVGEATNYIFRFSSDGDFPNGIEEIYDNDDSRQLDLILPGYNWGSGNCVGCDTQLYVTVQVTTTDGITSESTAMPFNIQRGDYVCDDIFADNYQAEPGNNEIVNNVACDYGVPPCRIAPTEFFYNDNDGGGGAHGIKVPDWIELTNFQKDGKDISNYYIEIRRSHPTNERISLSKLDGTLEYSANNNNGFLYTDIIDGRLDSDVHTYYCSDTGAYKYTLEECNGSCPSDCSEVKFGGKMWVISNHENNNYGNFKGLNSDGQQEFGFGDLLNGIDVSSNVTSWQSSDSDFTGVNPVPITYTDIEFPDDLYQYIPAIAGTCPSLPWDNDYTGTTGLFYIILWEGHPDENGTRECSVCFDSDDVAHGIPENGESLEFNSYGFNFNNSVSDQGNWFENSDCSYGDNCETWLFDTNRPSMGFLSSFLTYTLTEPSNPLLHLNQEPGGYGIFNDGISIDNFGSPLDVNSCYTSQQVAACTDGESGGAALNYLCCTPEYVDNFEVCPYGCDTIPGLLPSYVVPCNTSGVDNDCCYYELEPGCNDPSSLTYFCIDADHDLCFECNEDAIEGGACEADDIGNILINSDCCDSPEDDVCDHLCIDDTSDNLNCEYPVVFYFGDINNTLQTTDLRYYSHWPIENIGELIITGMRVTSISNLPSGWTLFSDITVTPEEPDGETVPVSRINFSTSVDLPLPGIPNSDYTTICNGIGECGDVGQQFVTLHYSVLENDPIWNGNVSFEVYNNHADYPSEYVYNANEVVTTSTVQTDCIGHPYYLDHPLKDSLSMYYDMDYTVTDNCEECILVSALANGCWYYGPDGIDATGDGSGVQAEGTLCTHCYNAVDVLQDPCNTCAGCDGIPNSGQVYDDCQVCNGTEYFNGEFDVVTGIGVHPSVIVDDGSTTTSCNCLGDIYDCGGVCGGNTVIDDCGVCGGDNSTCLDDCGIPNGGNATNLGCGCNFGTDDVIAGPNTYCDDGDGDGFGCGTTATSFCVAYGNTLLGTESSLLGEAVGNWISDCNDQQCNCDTNNEDICGVCAGDNSSCSGCLDSNQCGGIVEGITFSCDNHPDHSGEFDCCDYTTCCSGNGTTEETGSCVCEGSYCPNELQGCNLELDNCGICDGDGYVEWVDEGNSTGLICDCSGNTYDCAGGCTSSDLYDCQSVCEGSSTLDDCGVCDGGNQDQDCLGECFGDNVVDMCGTCDADSSNNCVPDCCNNVGCCGYTGGTWVSPNCWGGSGTNDFCSICEGDDTTCQPIFEFRNFDYSLGRIELWVKNPTPIVSISQFSFLVYSPSYEHYSGDYVYVSDASSQNAAVTDTTVSQSTEFWLDEESEDPPYILHNLAVSFTGPTTHAEFTKLVTLHFTKTNGGWLPSLDFSIYATPSDENNVIYRNSITASEKYPQFDFTVYTDVYTQMHGCIDPYARNCNGILFCNCAESFPNCATLNDNSCEYPGSEGLTFINSLNDTENIAVTNPDTCGCVGGYNFGSDVSCEVPADLATEVCDQQAWTPTEYNPFDIEDGLRHPYNFLKFNFLSNFTSGTADYDRGVGWPFTLSNADGDVLNTWFGYGLYHIDSATEISNQGKFQHYCEDFANCGSVDTESFVSTFVTDGYYNSESNCSSSYCPFNGEYMLSVYWPWNWESLLDPLTDDFMTSPRSIYQTKFNFKGYGCQDSSPACNYSEAFQYDCLGGDGGDLDCCRYNTPDIIGSVCCPGELAGEGDKDECGYCPGDKIGDVEVYGVGKITYYQDFDNDGLGCPDSGTIALCPHQDPANSGSYFHCIPGNCEVKCTGECDDNLVGFLWPDIATLENVESENGCNCATNIWDEYCDECSKTCTTTVVTSSQFNAYISEVTNNPAFPGSELENAIGTSSECGDDGICVDNVCRYVDDCGLCKNRQGSFGPVPLQGGLDFGNQTMNIDVNTTFGCNPSNPGCEGLGESGSHENNNKDCHGVCFPQSYQFYDIDGSEETNYPEDGVYDSSLFGAYYDDCSGDYGEDGNYPFGVCSGGATDHESNSDKDECDVCFGDNSSCAGCDGVPNSGLVNDDCGNCDGDCVDLGMEFIQCYGSENNDISSDCFGVCGGSATEDSFGVCCSALLGPLWPDLDLTSSTDGNCEDNFNGCTGEPGFCPDGGEFIFRETSIVNPIIDEGWYCFGICSGNVKACNDDGDCYDVGGTCDAPDMIMNNSITVCEGTALPYLDESGFNAQPTGEDYALVDEWIGHYYLETDYCNGYGPDSCNQCWTLEESAMMNSDLDCLGVCFGDSEWDTCGVCEGLDQCGGCMDPIAQNYDSSAPADCDNCYPAQGCFPVTDNLEYEYTIWCCNYYWDSNLTKLGHCSNDVETTCTTSGACGGADCYDVVIWGSDIKQGYPVTLNWSFDTTNPLNDSYERFFVYRNYPNYYRCSDGSWSGEDETCNGGCVQQEYAEENTCNSVLYPLSEIIETVDGNYTFIDDLTDVGSTGDPELIGDTLTYSVESENAFSSTSPQEITVDVTHIVPSFNLSFVDGMHNEKEYYTILDKIWAVVDYDYIPINISNEFSIQFIGNGWQNTPSLDQLGYLAWDSQSQTGWSDGNDGSLAVPVTDGKWYCPLPIGRWVYGNDVTVDKEFSTQSACENPSTSLTCEDNGTPCFNQPYDSEECAGIGNEVCNGWQGCYNSADQLVNCVQYYYMYFDITNAIWNNATPSGHTETEENSGIFEIPTYVYYPAGSSVADASATLTIHMKEGCIDTPVNNEDIWMNGACTCDTCDLTCGTCSDNESTNYWDCKAAGGTFTSHCDEEHTWDNPPAECLEEPFNFFNPSASWDYCALGGLPSLAHTCTSDYDCIVTHNLGDDYRCNASCEYPVYGCIDDGVIDALQPNGEWYVNNQNSMGHVLPDSYKCADESGYLIDYGGDSTCSRTVNGLSGLCIGYSSTDGHGHIFTNFYTEIDCIDCQSDYQCRDTDNTLWSFGGDSTCGGGALCTFTDCEDVQACPRTWYSEVECVGDCTLQPSPASNYVDAAKATYDPNGECRYGGCIDKTSMNYSIPETSDDYDWEVDGYDYPVTWITNASCVLPFDFDIEYQLFYGGTLHTVGKLPMGKDENAHCEVAGETVESDGQSDCENNLSGTWVIDWYLIRKSFEGDDGTIKLILIGGEGYNCIGDEVGTLYNDEEECISNCEQYSEDECGVFNCITNEEIPFQYPAGYGNNCDEINGLCGPDVIATATCTPTEACAVGAACDELCSERMQLSSGSGIFELDVIIDAFFYPPDTSCGWGYDTIIHGEEFDCTAFVTGININPPINEDWGQRVRFYTDDLACWSEAYPAIGSPNHIDSPCPSDGGFVNSVAFVIITAAGEDECHIDDQCLYTAMVEQGYCHSACGTCKLIGDSDRSAVWYPTEEYPFGISTFTLNDGVCRRDDADGEVDPEDPWNAECTSQGGGWVGSYAGDGAPTSDGGCEQVGDECFIIDMVNSGYFYPETPAPADLDPVDVQYNVKVIDPNPASQSANGEHLFREKKINIKYIRNDIQPYLVGVTYNGVEQNVEGGLLLDMAYEGDYIFSVQSFDIENSIMCSGSTCTSPSEEIVDEVYYSVEQISNNEQPDLSVSIANDGTLFIAQPEYIGAWTVTIYLHQDPWEEIPYYDLTLYHKGVSENCTCEPYSIEANCSCIKLEFDISVIDSSGPEGNIVPTLVPSFGVSDNKYLFFITGNDIRERIHVPEGINNFDGDETYDFPNPNYGGWVGANFAKMSEADVYCEQPPGSVTQYTTEYLCIGHGVCVGQTGQCYSAYSDSIIGENFQKYGCTTHGDCISIGLSGAGVVTTEQTYQQCASNGICVSNTDYICDDSGNPCYPQFVCDDGGGMGGTSCTNPGTQDNCGNGGECVPEEDLCGTGAACIPSVTNNTASCSAFGGADGNDCIEHTCGGSDTYEPYTWAGYEWTANTVYDTQDVFCALGTFTPYEWIGPQVDQSFNEGKGLNFKDTIWRYELFIYKCEPGTDCDEEVGQCSNCVYTTNNEGIACGDIDNQIQCINNVYENGGVDGTWESTETNIVEGYPKSWRDWSVEYPLGEDSIPGDYYPPIYSATINEPGNHEWPGNTYTQRYVCGITGNYCGPPPGNAGLYCPGEVCELACEYYNNCVGTREGTWISDLIYQGHYHTFEEPGEYKIVAKAYDLYWSDTLVEGDDGMVSGTRSGYDAKFLSVERVIPIVQSLPQRYLPWQGINIPEMFVNDGGDDEVLDIENLETRTMYEDLDGRAALGLFVFADDDDTDLPWHTIASGSYSDPYDKSYEGEGSLENIIGDDFMPDVDARTPMSLQGKGYDFTKEYSTLFKYYDPNLQPQLYADNTAPTQVQLYFYAREIGDGKLFSPKTVIPDHFNHSSYFIGFLDWGDGSDMEYNSEPIQLDWEKTFDHTYDEPGVYEIRGRMMRAVREGEIPATCEAYCQILCSYYDFEPQGQDNPVWITCNSTCLDDCGSNGLPETPGDMPFLGVDKHHKFKIKININADIESDEEFTAIGGTGYNFIPYNNTSLLVGGVSRESIYYKSISRHLGYIGDSDNPYDLNFQNYGDRLSTEYALSLIDESRVGDEINKFTGSSLHRWEHSTITDGATPVKIYSGSYCDNWDTCVGSSIQLSASLAPGFFTASINQYGQVDGEAVLIGYGKYNKREELGDHLGDTNLGQIRYFTKPSSMYEMLGFDDNEAGNPGSNKYWKNIIPPTQSVYEREGVTISPGNLSVDEDSLQRWNGENNYGNIYYYPVLPKFNQFGLFSDNLGLQGNFEPLKSNLRDELIPNGQYTLNGLLICEQGSSIGGLSISGDGGCEIMSDAYLPVNWPDIESQSGITTTQGISDNLTFWNYLQDEVVTNQDASITWLDPLNITQEGHQDLLTLFGLSIETFEGSGIISDDGSQAFVENGVWVGDLDSLDSNNGQGSFYTFYIHPDFYDIINLPLNIYDYEYGDVSIIESVIIVEASNQPYGSDREWNGVDDNAPVTNDGYSNEHLLVDLAIDNVSSQDLIEDNSGNENVGLVIGDFRMNFEAGSRKPERNDIINGIKTDSQTDKKAY